MSGPIRQLTRVAYAPGRDVLAAAGGDDLITLYDAGDGRQVREIATMSSGRVTAMSRVTLADGAVVLAAACGNELTLWDVAGAVRIGSPMCGHSRSVQAVTAVPVDDGGTRQLLASAAGDGTICRWDPDTRQLIGEPLQGSLSTIFAMTTVRVAGRHLLVTGGQDRDLRLWDPVSGDMVVEVSRPHDGAIVALAYLGSGTQGVLVSADETGCLRFWTPHPDRLTPVGDVLQAHVDAVLTVTAIPADEQPLFVSAGRDGAIRRWSPTAEPVGQPASGHIGSVLALETVQTADGDTVLASAGQDATVRLWDPRTGESRADPVTGRIHTLIPIPARRGELLAAGHDDGAISLIEPAVTGVAVRSVMQHTGRVYALTHLADPDGRTRIASAGRDGRILLWDVPDDASSAPEPQELVRDIGAIYALARITLSDGTIALAVAGSQGDIRLYDPQRGLLRRLTGNRGTVYALAAVRVSGSGSVGIAAAGQDGVIRLWDLRSGSVTAELSGHRGAVHHLAAVTSPDGRWQVVSAGADGTVRLWSRPGGPTSGRTVARHIGWVLDIAVLNLPDGRSLVVSTGEDGRVLLTDLATEQARSDRVAVPMPQVSAVTPVLVGDGTVQLACAGSRRRIELRGVFTQYVAVQFPGASDRPAEIDRLDRNHLVKIITATLQAPAAEPWQAGDVASKDASGPTVLAVEGSWGSGKTSLLRMVHDRLGAGDSHPVGVRRPRLTAARADILLGRSDPRRFLAPVALRRRFSRSGTGREAGRPRVVTAWFNPWAHQTSDQVWAGLAKAILTAVAAALYPDENARERYWLSRNRRHVHARTVQWALRRRTISPLFAFAAFAVLAPVVARLLDPTVRYPIGTTWRAVSDFTWHGVHLAVILPVLLALVAFLHWALRYQLTRASRWLPPELFHGPLPSSGQLAGGSGLPESIRDPLYNARAGYLYLLQHDIKDVLEDLRATGAELVVFIDDLDRCGPKTTAEVLEAINLFLSDQLPASRFVIGLDPVIVAAHLDHVYRDLSDRGDAVRPEDPSPGWTFLRKLVQLPIVLPRPTAQATDGLLDHLLGPATIDVVQEATAEPPGAGPQAGTGAGAAPDLVSTALDASGDDRSPAVPPEGTAVAERPPGRPDDTGAGAGANAGVGAGRAAAPGPAARTVVSTVALERHPAVRALLRQRLLDQPDRSARDVKRLLTAWQFYARVLDTHMLLSGQAAVARACHIVVLAEIITRWPALQRRLQTAVDDEPGLVLLARHVREDVAWGAAVARLDLSGRADAVAVRKLRTLLREHDGVEVAALARQIW